MQLIKYNTWIKTQADFDIILSYYLTKMLKLIDKDPTIPFKLLINLMTNKNRIDKHGHEKRTFTQIIVSYPCRHNNTSALSARTTICFYLSCMFTNF